MHWSITSTSFQRRRKGLELSQSLKIIVCVFLGGKEVEQLIYMERKLDVNKEEDRVQSSQVATSVLKREIASHSLYEHLVESHLDCLKLCLGNLDNTCVTFTPRPPLNLPDLSTPDQLELDQFMEAYCVALKKLKKVIEEPQQESMAFINYMYSQLEELLLEDI